MPSQPHQPTSHTDTHATAKHPTQSGQQDGRSNSECREKPLERDLPWPLHWCLQWEPTLYGFAVESRTFLYRIGLRCRRRYRYYRTFGFSAGPYLEFPEGQPPRRNRRTNACIVDIRRFVETHPAATFVDVELYRDAWLAGAEWVVRNSDSKVLVQSRPTSEGEL